MSAGQAIEVLNHAAFSDELPPSQNLMKQYEKMIVTTLLRSFALDFLIKDQNGGNVDTPLTARKYGLKDEEAQKRYDSKNRGDYSDKNVKKQYHSNNFIDRNREASELKKQGKLFDAYTGQKIAPNGKYDLDHTISAKEIHDDRAVYLANLNGADLAVADTNLNHTNQSINRAKGKKTMDQFLDDLNKKQGEYESRISQLKKQESLTDKERKELNKLTNLSQANAEKMKEADANSRKEYNKTITKAYLSDKKTYINAGKDALNTGWKMGARQTLGLILAEVWIIARQRFPLIMEKMKEKFSLKEFLLEAAGTFKEAFQAVKEKFKELIAAFANGMLAGILSSISTFIINFFTGTAKHAVKMIREFWGSITQIFDLLVFNRQNLSPGELAREISKVIGLAAAVLAGTLVAERLESTGIGDLPVIGEALTIFLSGLTTGVISISLVYFIDHSKEIQKLVKFLDGFADQLELKRQYYAELNEQIKQKVSELSSLPIDQLNKQLANVQMLTQQMKLADTDDELNEIVTKTIRTMGLDLPYQDREGLKQFMQDKQAVLHFE
ncbi:hypothetical protein BK139_06850 [Paenibacillus sp. FSL R5-0490]|uniref:hypothetical protein n=1 Tax=Paenibacillus sp. FSL R5-0490 TaxID=1920424 RepID=UPI00096C71A2|nr:hypothetical protein [Paenibacillus sp. FSL R5-0490]OMF61550.1 hypothetical protein BK139_06850 [Paenibacillus sp. FSL R5-0490]